MDCSCGNNINNSAPLYRLIEFVSMVTYISFIQMHLKIDYSAFCNSGLHNKNKNVSEININTTSKPKFLKNGLNNRITIPSMLII